MYYDRVTYRRIPRDPSQPLPPGAYELVLVLRAGNPPGRRELERHLSTMFGRRLAVDDYGVRYGQLVIRFTVHGEGTGAVQLAWLPLAITGVAIIAALVVVWRISVELVELVELVRDSPAVQVGLVSLGLGLVGGAILLWVILPRVTQKGVVI